MDWNKIPSLAALRAFEATARHRSFSKAARDLNVTRAAITHHVRSLEVEFSENLVEREGRGIAITPKGLQLAGDLQVGFDAIAGGVEKLHSSRELRPLNLAVTPVFAANWLMPHIGEFWAKYPEVLLNINPSLELVDLRRNDVDLAIRYGDGDWPGAASEMLTDGAFWVVAKSEILSGIETTCLADVIDLPWILERNMIERKAIIEREGINLEQVELTLLNTNSLVLAAVVAGLGVSVQSKAVVERYVLAGELTKICELNQEDLGYYMVMNPDRDPTGLRVLKRWLRASFGS